MWVLKIVDLVLIIVILCILVYKIKGGSSSLYFNYKRGKRTINRVPSFSDEVTVISPS